VAGEQVVPVPPKLMAAARRGARTRGKSDPIDALAVAGAALREPDLPVARLDGPDREVRLLVDHREDLVAERTRAQQRRRWHLHELEPGWQPPAGALDRARVLDAVQARVAAHDGIVAQLAAELVARCRELTARINQLQRQLEQLVAPLAPSLLGLAGCGG
jgi:transposase